MTPEEIETLNGSSRVLKRVRKSINSLFHTFDLILTDTDEDNGIPSVMMVAGFDDSIGLAGSPVNTLSRRAPRPAEDASAA